MVDRVAGSGTGHKRSTRTPDPAQCERPHTSQFTCILPDLHCDCRGQFFVAFGVNLRHVSAGVTE